MWIMTPTDRAELEAYRALGSVDELKARLSRPYPDEHQRKRHSGLLEEDA